MVERSRSILTNATLIQRETLELLSKKTLTIDMYQLTNHPMGTLMTYCTEDVRIYIRAFRGLQLDPLFQKNTHNGTDYPEDDESVGHPVGQDGRGDGGTCTRD